MKNTFFLLLVFLCGAVIARGAQADSTASTTLKLNQAIELALEQGFDARMQRLELIQAQQNVLAQKGRFRTQIDMDFLAPRFDESVADIARQGETSYYQTVGNLRWESLLSITQPLPTDGSFSLVNRVYQNRQSVYLEDDDSYLKDKKVQTSFALEFNQPLFVPNELKLGLERANLQHERAQRQYTRTELNVVYDVTASFYALYRATRSLEIAREEQKQQEDAYDLAQRKFDAGLIPEVEALQMEVDLAQSRNRAYEAESNLSQVEDRFKIDVGLPLEEQVKVETDFEIRDIQVNEDEALTHGLRHRTEIREREISRRLAEITLKETDALSTIRGELSASYEITGISESDLDYSASLSDYFNSSWDDLRRRPRNRGVTFTLSVPIWDSGVNKAQVAAAQAELDLSDLNMEEIRKQVARDIRAVISRLHETRNRLDVLKRSEEVARRSYDISQSRFDNGDITSQELALDRDRLTAARTNYLDAYIDYQLAIADLKRNTLYDWERGVSLVEVAGEDGQ